MPQDDGEPIQIPNAICMFERSICDPAWRHYPLLAADDPPVRRNSYPHYQLSEPPYARAGRVAGDRFAMMSDGSDTLGA